MMSCEPCGENNGRGWTAEVVRGTVEGLGGGGGKGRHGGQAVVVRSAMGSSDGVRSQPPRPFRRLLFRPQAAAPCYQGVPLQRAQQIDVLRVRRASLSARGARALRASPRRVLHPWFPQPLSDSSARSTAPTLVGTLGHYTTQIWRATHASASSHRWVIAPCLRQAMLSSPGVPLRALPSVAAPRATAGSVPIGFLPRVGSPSNHRWTRAGLLLRSRPPPTPRGRTTTNATPPAAPRPTTLSACALVCAIAPLGPSDDSAASDLAAVPPRGSSTALRVAVRRATPPVVPLACRPPTSTAWLSRPFSRARQCCGKQGNHPVRETYRRAALAS
ncbi:hypothetical protein ABZP36_017656 [Zizania latifolia]